MQAELKMENSKVMARHTGGDPWIRSPDKIRVAHGKTIKIAHWINPSTMEAAWVLDSIRMPMLYSPRICSDREFATDRGGDAKSKIVNYDRCVLVQGSLGSINDIHLVSAETGELLAGSNVFSDSYTYRYALCLGTGFDPTNLSPIEALLHNQANRDLEWIGHPLEGEWDDQSIFHVTTWPESDAYVWTIPSQIKENIDAWSRC